MKQHFTICFIVLATILNAQITLPYFEGFEGMIPNSFLVSTPSLPGAPEWAFETNIPNGRLRANIDPTFVRTGNIALTLDTDPAGSTAINYLTGTLDMSNYDATNDLITFSCHLMEHGDEVSPNDKVWVRGDSSATWIEINDWNTSSGGVDGVYFALINIDLSAALIGVGQNFSVSTQIRFGQEDNFPATSISASDGLTIDDISIELIQAIDLSVVEILGQSNICGDSMSTLDIVVENKGSMAQVNYQVNADITGDITEMLTATGVNSIAFGQKDTITMPSFNSYSGGNAIVNAYTSLAMDLNNLNDTSNFVIDYTAIVNPIPVTSYVCDTISDAYAITQNIPGYTTRWFNNSNLDSLLGSGDSLNIGPLQTNSTLYAVSQSEVSETLGLQDNSSGGGLYSFYTDGLVFSATEAFVLDSVWIYPENADTLVVNVLTSTGTLITSASVVVDSVPTGTYVPLNLAIPAGVDMQINANGTTISQLFRTNGSATFPYSNLGNQITITGAINGLAGYYYFFYDWHVSVLGCAGSPIPVTVSVSQLDMSTVTSINVDCNGASTGSIDFTPAGGVAPYTFLWSNGATTEDLTNLAAGVYSGTTTDAVGCSVSGSVTITEPAALTVASTVTDPTTGNNGAIDLTISGGTIPYTYLWSNGETTEDISSLATAAYDVTITDSNGCTITESVNVGPVGTVDQGIFTELAIFPNPVTDVVSVHFTLPTESDVSMEITGLNGQIFERQFLTATSAGNFSASLDLYPSGVYFLTLVVDQEVITRRITKL